MRKRIINPTNSKYEVFPPSGGHFTITPNSSAVFEDRVANEFMKYYRSVLREEIVKEAPVSVPKPVSAKEPVEAPKKKTSSVKVVKKVKKIIKKTLTAKPAKKKGKSKKSKK